MGYLKKYLVVNSVGSPGRIYQGSFDSLIEAKNCKDSINGWLEPEIYERINDEEERETLIKIMRKSQEEIKEKYERKPIDREALVDQMKRIIRR